MSLGDRRHSGKVALCAPACVAVVIEIEESIAKAVCNGRDRFAYLKAVNAKAIPKSMRTSTLSPSPVQTLLLAVALGVGGLFFSYPAIAAPVERPHIIVELVTEHESFRPGTRAPIGIRLAPEPNWHVYWRNPGDSGLPPKIQWTTPAGYTVGEFQWPHPAVISTPPFVTYGYHSDVLLLADLTIPDDAKPGSLAAIRAKAAWLVCQDDGCVPGKADLELKVPIEAGPPLPDSRWTREFREARRALPKNLEGWTTRAWNEDENVVLELVAPSDADPQLGQVAAFPLEQAILDHSAPQSFERDGRTLRLTLKRSGDRMERVSKLSAVLVSPDAWNFEGDVHAVNVDVAVATRAAAAVATVTPNPPPAPGPPMVGTAEVASPAINKESGLSGEPLAADRIAGSPHEVLPLESDVSLLSALLLAFVGGLILNLMPCVFPVLSLKILGFVESAHHDAASIRRHGHAFAAGVILSFLLLAGLLLALREGGRELGWGFQLQSPAFVAFMVLIIFTMALNLLGVFEIGTSLTGVAGRLDKGEGYSGSFLSGVLATVLATPCTAPFMGTALGFALSQPATSALAVFAMLGVGMAAPYVLLSYQPALLARLPRPGAWMVTFKQAMAFPLLATSVWLLWVFGQQVGHDGVVQLLLAMVLLSFGVWLMGHFAAANLSSAWRALTRTFTTAAIVASFYFGIAAADFRAPSLACASGCGPSEVVGPQAWTPFDPGLLRDLRAAGRPVFLDFTAAWCLSCKVNERVALSSDEVWNAFANKGIVAMKADWTDGDPAITRALAEFGRSSVPFYVLYHGDADTDPIVLPEILKPSIVLDAIAEAQPPTA